jgi:shikimate dehydrogenase
MQFGLLGKSLKHSFSKKYFAEKFINLGLNDYTYSNFELSAIDQFEQLNQSFPHLYGLNVTIPYKTAIIPYLLKLDDKAREINAVNTLKKTKKGWVGFNTDWYGFTESLTPLLSSHHRKALILGTGGASNAIQVGLQSLNISSVKVSRNPTVDEISYEQASEQLNDYMIVVNTTPAGTFPDVKDKPPLNLRLVGSHHLFYDLIYNPEKTALLSLAESKGATIKNGHEMLVLQAEKSWQIWNEV